MLLLLRSFNERALGTRIKESKLFENDHSEVYYRNFKRSVRLKAEKIRPNPQKRWINKSSMQSRNVHDFFTETVKFKQKQLDDISLRRIKMLFSGWSESLPSIRKSREFIFRIISTPVSRLQIQGVYKEIVSKLRPDIKSMQIIFER